MAYKGASYKGTSKGPSQYQLPSALSFCKTCQINERGINTRKYAPTRRGVSLVLKVGGRSVGTNVKWCRERESCWGESVIQFIFHGSFQNFLLILSKRVCRILIVRHLSRTEIGITLSIDTYAMGGHQSFRCGSVNIGLNHKQ